MAFSKSLVSHLPTQSWRPVPGESGAGLRAAARLPRDRCGVGGAAHRTRSEADHGPDVLAGLVVPRSGRETRIYPPPEIPSTLHCPASIRTWIQNGLFSPAEPAFCRSVMRISA